MQLILKAFVDVILLRKGPEDIPKSLLLLAVAVVMIIVSQLLLHAMVETKYNADLFLEFATELLKVGLYVAVLFVSGYISRIAQTITAIIGCTAIMVLLFVAIFVMSRPFIGQELAGAIAWFVSPWLILVEGHIISRSIQRHWFTGIAIAVVIFILQLAFYLTFSDLPEGAVS
ncbi:MAG: hypothetical protein ACE5KS_04970 [Woeseiaceae bacterium]